MFVGDIFFYFYVLLGAVGAVSLIKPRQGVYERDQTFYDMLDLATCMYLCVTHGITGFVVNRRGGEMNYIYVSVCIGVSDVIPLCASPKSAPQKPSNNLMSFLIQQH